MSRIKSHNIQLGESFVVPIEESAHRKKIQEAIEKEKEIILQGEKKAQEIVEQAQIQGQQIIEDAKNQALSEVDAITQQAYQEGFEAGRQEGLENITHELQDKIISVNDFTKSNFDIKNNIVKSAYSDIIKLVVEIAHKVCSKSLELDDKILKEITQNAIQTLKDKENITIIVNPEMAEKIYEISNELKEKIPQLESIKIIEDNSVSPDGTIVESPLSRVDSRVRSQINEIAEKLMGKLNSTPLENEEERAKREEEKIKSKKQNSLCHCEEQSDEVIQEENTSTLQSFSSSTEENIEAVVAPVEEDLQISAEKELQGGLDDSSDLADEEVQDQIDAIPIEEVEES